MDPPETPFVERGVAPLMLGHPMSMPASFQQSQSSTSTHPQPPPQVSLSSSHHPSPGVREPPQQQSGVCLHIRRFVGTPFRPDHVMNDGFINVYYLQCPPGPNSFEVGELVCRYFHHRGFACRLFDSPASFHAVYPNERLEPIQQHWVEEGRRLHPPVPFHPSGTGFSDGVPSSLHPMSVSSSSASQSTSMPSSYYPTTVNTPSVAPQQMPHHHHNASAPAQPSSSGHHHPSPSSMPPHSVHIPTPSASHAPSVSAMAPPTSTDESSVGGLTSVVDAGLPPGFRMENVALPKFSGDSSTFPAFRQDAETLLETPALNPGGSGEFLSRLVTTPENVRQSSNLRQVLMKYLTGPARDIFSYREEFRQKGFEMLKHLCERYAPQTPTARFLIYLDLINITQGEDEAVSTYFSRLRRTAARLRAASVPVDEILIVMFAMYGFNSQFDTLRQRFAENSDRYATFTLDDLEQEASTYLSVSQSFATSSGSNGVHASAAATQRLHRPRPNPADHNYQPPPVLRELLSKGTVSGAKCFCGFCGRPHHSHECYILTDFFAARGYVLVKDQSAADEVLKKNKEQKTKIRNKKSESPPPPSAAVSDTVAASAAASADPVAASATAAAPSSSPSDPTPSPRPPTPPLQSNSSPDDGDSESFNSISDGSIGSFFIHEESADPVVNASSVSVVQGGSLKQVDSGSSSSSGVKVKASSSLAYSIPFPSGDRRTALQRFLSTTSSSISHHMSASAVTKLGLASTDVCIADSGATDHLFPHYEAFISYHRLVGRYVRLADKNLAKIMGIGSVAVVLGGKKVVLHNVYHVPALRAPLFSLRAHRHQPQCGFIGDNKTFNVWFPTFSLAVDDTVDSYLSYSIIGRSAHLADMDYVQPKLGRTPVAASSAATLRRSRRLQERAAADHSSSPSSPTVASPPQPPPTPVPSEPASPAAPVPSEPASTAAPVSSSDAPPPILKKSVSWDSWKEDVIYHIPTRKCPSTWKIPPPPSPLSIPSDSHRRISTDELLLFSSNPHTSPPPVRACDTPNESDTLIHLTSDQIYKLFGNRRFRDYESFCSASKDGTFIQGGQPIPSIGEFATMRKRPRGKTRAPTPHYLERVHMDIVYGDVISRLGYRFALLLVDRATKYIWIYGLRHLTSPNIIEALEQFRADAGGLPQEFRCDCDQKLLGGDTRRWILKNESTINGSPAGRQSANGLVERYWQTLCSMARAYLVEKQMSRDYWFFAVQHAARMHNMIPGRVNGRLTTPFELVHRCPPDTRTWFPIFSMVYFYKDSDADKSRSTFQSNAMQGIAVGRSSTTNGLLVYHPGTKKYYEPDTYKFDPSRLPCNEWPNRNLRYDGGLVASLYRDSHANVPEPYPPGMPFQVTRDDGTTTTAIVSSIPFRDANGDVLPDSYHLQCPDGSLLSKTLLEMDELASSPANIASQEKSTPALPEVNSLPVWLQHGSKVTFDKDGEFHKGFIIIKQNGIPRFSCRRQMSSREESWGVDLPKLATEWPILTQDNVLIPSWSYSSFLRPASPHMHINVSHVSAAHLKESCPTSLRQALATSHPDRDTWLESYYEEKQALIDNDTYVKLTLEDYRRLRRKGASKAIPSMCVLVVKPDANLNPDRAKSRIVVLGNQDDRPWSKGDKYAPVLQYSSLRLLTSMAVEKRRRLKQGDAKNAFCQGTLPADETTIIKPPPGDPDAAPDEYWLLKKCLYGLSRSPRHWYDLISSTLKEMGLQPSAHDPCLWIGHPSDSSTSTSTSTTEPPLHLGLYVDDFVYFSESDEVERRFERLLASKIKVDFMGTVNWFLGSHFNWADHADGALSVHISQSAYAQHIVERYKLDSSNFNPHATPYRAGCPIDSIPPATIDELDKWFVQRRDNYRSLVGALTWLATNTRPDLAPVVSFLASYSSCPAAQHWEAAKYVVRYLRSTVDHGIAYHSASSSQTSAYVHFPFPHDKEAYSDAVTPAKEDMHELSTFTDACWGSQIGNSIPDGEEVDMWKFRSMSGFLVMRCGGPIAWKSVRQDRCSRSSCEAEIRATDEGIKEVLSLRARCQDMSLSDASRPTPVYNDNQGCVDWSKTTSTKGLRHLNIRDCAVRDSIQAKEVTVHHIQGIINPADIFTKEMKDGLHFRTLRDSFMMSRESFRRFVHDAQVPVSASWVSGITLTCL